MTRMNFPTMLSLQFILIILVYTQNIAAGTCRSTEQMKQAAVNEVLNSLNCDSYYCGK